MMQHGTYDEFWQSRDLRRHLKDIKPAVMTVGGWFDAEDLFGALNTYQAIEKSSPGAHNTLVMGPWYHGGWSRSDGDLLGNVHFGSKTAEFYRDQIEFPFFNFWLKGKGDPKLPEAYRLRDRHEPVAARGRLAAQGRRVRRRCTCRPDGKLSLRRRRRRPARRSTNT